MLSPLFEKVPFNALNATELKKPLTHSLIVCPLGLLKREHNEPKMMTFRRTDVRSSI
jgi:hypothetical protein